MDTLGQMKPAAWAVGQRRRGKIFGCADGTGEVHYDGEYTVRERVTDGSFDWSVDVPGDYWFACESWPSELLSPPPVAGERDWGRWLPPRELPRDKSVTYKPGQVWALRWDKGHSSGHVFRVVEADRAIRFGGPDNHWLTIEGLAGDYQGSGYSNRDYTERAILVQDVEQAEPTPPEVLFGRPPALSGGGAPTLPLQHSVGCMCERCQRDRKPLWREVFAGGSWLPYDKLIDPDPFDAYRVRRVDGVVVVLEESRGYGGLTFAQHAKEDSEIHPGGLWRKRKKPEPRPVEATPGSTVAQSRAYRPRSLPESGT